jgi:hypothetical protein
LFSRIDFKSWPDAGRHHVAGIVLIVTGIYLTTSHR